MARSLIQKDVSLIGGFCDRCKKKKSCEKPCRFVELIVKGEDTPVMERYEHDLIICFAQARKLSRFSEINCLDEKSFDENVTYLEPEEELEMSPERDIAAVFFKRFFEKKDYDTIAGELGITVKACWDHYFEAKKQAMRILKHLDKKVNVFENMTRIKDRLPKEQVWFLMSRVWGLSAPDIQDLWPEKMSLDTIETGVRDVAKGAFVSHLRRQEMAMERLAEHKNRLPKERVWFMLTNVWGLTIPQVQKLWPRKYSKSYISSRILETKAEAA